MESKENKKTIRIFLWASFLNDMGSDMIYPIWPLFVTTVLKADMAALGFLDGLDHLFAFGGVHGQRVRRRLQREAVRWGPKR